MPASESFLHTGRARGRALVAAALSVLAGARLSAQTPRPSPTPNPGPILTQDEIDLQSRTSLILGSGARALGMGGAFLARADDATAASWNPAGLSYLRRPEMSLVGARNASNANVEGGDRNRFRGVSPDFGAITFPLSVKNAGGAVQLSFQRVIPFDGTRSIDRISGGASVSAKSSGGFDVVALGTGWKLMSRLRLGVTLNRWLGGFEQDQERNVAPRPRDITTHWTMRGWNTNLGLIFSPSDSVNLAVVGKTPFRARVRLEKSRTDFLLEDDGGRRPISSNAYESDAVRLDFPGAIGFGASWRPESKLTLSADYTRTFWSDAYIYSYFVIRVSDTATPTIGQPINQPPPAGDVFAKLPYPYFTQTTQSDSEQIRFGVEYVFISGRLKIPVRAGYFNDRQIRLERGGRAPRYNGLTVGTGLIVGPLLLDAAYLYEYGSYVDNTDLTNITQRTHQVLASVIYRFGGRP